MVRRVHFTIWLLLSFGVSSCDQLTETIQNKSNKNSENSSNQEKKEKDGDQPGDDNDSLLNWDGKSFLGTVKIDFIATE